MSRLTIRARLIILSGALLCMLIATNLYLIRTLAKNSTAVATETELSSIIESANGARIGRLRKIRGMRQNAAQFGPCEAEQRLDNS